MVWMEHGLHISLKRYELSMKDEMAAGGFGRARNDGWGFSFPLFCSWQAVQDFQRISETAARQGRPRSQGLMSH